MCQPSTQWYLMAERDDSRDRALVEEGGGVAKFSDAQRLPSFIPSHLLIRQTLLSE